MDEHVKRTYIVEDQWKCPSCGTDNLGRDLKCKGCGAAKPKAAADEVDAEAAEEVTDEKLLGMARAGENWFCQYCGSQDRASDGKCKNCGAAQKDAAEPPKVEAPSPVLPPPGPSHWGRRLLVVALIGAGLFYWLRPRQKVATVERTHWVYTVDIAQRSLVHHADFNSPRDAMNVTCEQRQHGTRDCNPYTCGTRTEHFDCRPHDCHCHKVTHHLKNGFSEVSEVCSTCYDSCSRDVSRTCYQQCPVYSQYCNYDQVQWSVVQTMKAEGDGQDVRWPSAEARTPDTRLDKHEQYEVAFRADSKPFEYAPKDFADYRRFKPGDRWELKVGPAGGVSPEHLAR